MSGPPVIEVGASQSDGKLRFWLAKEAVRQGELRLASQATARTALEARATAITGWAAAALLALAAAFFATSDLPARGAVLLSGLMLFVAAWVAVHTARPRAWRLAGYSPKTILNDPRLSELEVLEASALGMEPSIAVNDGHLTEMGSSLRKAGFLLVFAPIMAGASYLELKANPIQNFGILSSIGAGTGGAGNVAMTTSYQNPPTASNTTNQEH